MSPIQDRWIQGSLHRYCDKVPDGSPVESSAQFVLPLFHNGDTLLGILLERYEHPEREYTFLGDLRLRVENEDEDIIVVCDVASLPPWWTRYRDKVLAYESNAIRGLYISDLTRYPFHATDFIELVAQRPVRGSVDYAVLTELKEISAKLAEDDASAVAEEAPYYGLAGKTQGLKVITRDDEIRGQPRAFEKEHAGSEDSVKHPADLGTSLGPSPAKSLKERMWEVGDDTRAAVSVGVPRGVHAMMDWSVPIRPYEDEGDDDRCRSYGDEMTRNAESSFERTASTEPSSSITNTKARAQGPAEKRPSHDASAVASDSGSIGMLSGFVEKVKGLLVGKSTKRKYEDASTSATDTGSVVASTRTEVSSEATGRPIAMPTRSRPLPLPQPVQASSLVKTWDSATSMAPLDDADMAGEDRGGKRPRIAKTSYAGATSIDPGPTTTDTEAQSKDLAVRIRSRW